MREHLISLRSWTMYCMMSGDLSWKRRAGWKKAGLEILKLNIGNPAPFGFSAPEEVILDIRQSVRDSQGYSDSRGIFAARKAIMQYCQLKGDSKCRYQ